MNRPDPKLKEACGVVGIWRSDEAPGLAVTGLYALQHRGQESAGVATLHEDHLSLEKDMGLVADVFTRERLARMKGMAAIGHVRYSTTGSSSKENAQPLVFRSRFGSFAIAHNGNLVNAYEVRLRLEDDGAIFQTTTDTEVIAHMIARSRAKSLDEALREALLELRGGYALVLLHHRGILAVRDPASLRPLVIGERKGLPVVASESCAIEAMGGEFLGDIYGGELVSITDEGVERRPDFLPPGPYALCSFEFIYFARPDAIMDGQTVLTVRRRLGEELAREAPTDADIVVGVPDSSIPVAEGFSRALGIPVEAGLAKNRYIGRTFIQPSQGLREAALKLKLAAIPEVVRGKRVALVDDSLVRGTTASYLVKLLRAAGATAVHLRIASPPYRHPCHYGIDTSNREELLANGLDEEAISRSVGADTIAFLSPEGVSRAIGRRGCMACFTGEYPVSVVGAAAKGAAEVDL